MSVTASVFDIKIDFLYDLIIIGSAGIILPFTNSYKAINEGYSTLWNNWGALLMPLWALSYLLLAYIKYYISGPVSLLVFYILFGITILIPSVYLNLILTNVTKCMMVVAFICICIIILLNFRILIPGFVYSSFLIFLYYISYPLVY